MGDFWYFWVIPAVGGLIWWLISSALVSAPGALLQNKFANFIADNDGVIAGKTLEQVKSACGAPSAFSALGDGQKLYQWQATGYHIALIFDENDICVGISSEIKV